jgi:hypothetical protein
MSIYPKTILGKPEQSFLNGVKPVDAYQRQFDIRKTTSAYWHSKSHDLLVSARTLWKAMQENRSLEVNCWATYMMLMGMSFELILKAHCVGAGTSHRATHDLVELARTAQFTTSKQETGILKVLTGFIIWDGRYPSPKIAKQLEDHWRHQRDVMYDAQGIGELNAEVLNDKMEFENLISIWRVFSDSYLERY